MGSILRVDGAVCLVFLGTAPDSLAARVFEDLVAFLSVRSRVDFLRRFFAATLYRRASSRGRVLPFLRLERLRSLGNLRRECEFLRHIGQRDVFLQRS